MKHHIVSIGISKHKESAANLQFAAKDAKEFYTLFTQNVSDLGYTKLLVDQEATLSEIKTALGKALRENVEQDDAFIFFYSGHGAVITDPHDDNLALSYLVPYDATGDIDSSCLSVDFLKEVFDSLPSKANMIFIDSCFSGHVARNSKAYPVPKSKSYKKLKSFSNTVTGNGTAIFTASKDSETSLEDIDYENGIFTYYILQELQKERGKDSYSVTSIFSPVVDGVAERAKTRWGHIQTPTLNGQFEGDLLLPTFKEKIKIKPSMIEVESGEKITNIRYSTPEILLGDKEKEKYLNQMIEFVLENQEKGRKGDVFFERLCHKLIRKMKEDWEIIFESTGRDVNLIPEAISKLEASAYQFMMLGGIVASFGSDKQMKIYSEYTLSILNFRSGLEGLIALIAVPEIIVLEIEYVIASICISRNNLDIFKVFLFDGQEEDTSMYGGSEIKNVYEHSRKIHYTNSLTGHSNVANDHVRDFLKNQDWLFELSPKLEGHTNDYQIQANFLLSMRYAHDMASLWPDFARWDGERILPFVNKLKKDKDFLSSVASIFNIDPKEVRPKLIEYVQKYRDVGLGGSYWWDSLRPEDFLTKEESEKEEI